jgi:hypothetical protein
LTDDCAGCVSSSACLWCKGEDKCFNISPEIAEATRQALLSEDDTGESGELASICAGTVTGSLLVCNLATPPPVAATAAPEPTEAPAPTGPPVASASPGTFAPNASSSYLLCTNILMNTIMSSICMTMLLLYRH